MDYAALNPQQREAVLFGEGALLILAGAGSGKTRVLTMRIAHLIKEQGIAPWKILAFTFTNKAAAEMKERVANQMDRPVDSMWIGTFHSICARLLRREIAVLGYDANFTIYDTADQRTLVKQILKSMPLAEKVEKPNGLLAKISDLKNQRISPSDYRAEGTTDFEKTVAEVYQRYEEEKRANNALDFDDLILKTLELFDAAPKVVERYQEQFDYIFVDEYQDTNRAQYELICAFAGGKGNLCVVGDADQSIYGWRGADIHNILDFEKDYPKARVILLEQNYRSTQVILDAANVLIQKNEERKDKNLWTENPKGDAVQYCLTGSEFEEAQKILQWINHEKYRGYAYADMAILYRTNAQSRPLEEALIREGIPYRMVGGLKYYDRAEIKDLLAYLTVIVNPLDDVALQRIVNQPKRGIGQTTMNKLQQKASDVGMALFDAMADAELMSDFSASTRKKIGEFHVLMEELQEGALTMPIAELTQAVYTKSGYEAMLQSSHAIEDQTRIENIEAFLAAAAQYEEDTEEANIVEYLQSLSLMSDLDKTEESKQGVSLMTIHSAKGLEFPIVFVVGLEDGLFPSRLTMDEGNLEEERRLCYVAMTRAEKKLYLSGAAVRRLYGGQAAPQLPSRFIEELEDRIERDVPEASFSPRGREAEEGYRLGESYEGAGRRFRSPKFADPQAREAYDERRDRIRRLVQEKKAALEAKKGDAYRVGDKVEHKKFGAGMVVSVVAREDGDEITVAFDKRGLKRLNAALAPLKKL